MVKMNIEMQRAIQDIAEKCGGYLTTSLFDQNRGSLPSWETLKGKYNISSFSELLDELNIKTKDQYFLESNRIKALSNLKILNLEHGYVSKKLYDEAKLKPSSDYISKHYGWNEIAKAAKVKLSQGQYASTEDIIKDLQSCIKNLGYIPTSVEYKELLLKPSPDSLSTHGLSWSDAMRKAGYKPYGMAVKVKDKVCVSDNCYRQFTPTTEAEKFCEPCFKKHRANIIKSFKTMNNLKLEEIATKLILYGNSQKNIIEIFDLN